ncbi:MAG: zinc-ribbon domain-containing protein [Rhizobiales bacterium]|nr:zinc-ribbon domain-containing protein [Hyphomicrobiales bacterium]
MLTVCPTCSSAYEVDDAHVARGAQVRCSFCHDVWRLEAPRPQARCAPTIDVEASAARSGPEPYPFDETPARRASSPPPAPRAVSLAPRRALVGLLAAAAVSAALAGREAVVARAPVAARFYAAIGLPVNLSGVEFRNVKSVVAEENGARILAVTGEVANLRDRTTPLPPLRVSVHGGDGRQIYVWTAEAPKSKLAAGETTSFRTRLAAPPDKARDVRVTLAEATASEKTKK